MEGLLKSIRPTLLSGATLAAAFGLAFVAAPAHASTKPVTHSSYYVTELNDATATSDGCSHGTVAEENGESGSEVILDFGAQLSGTAGAELPKSGGTDVSYSQIEGYAEAFEEAFTSCADGGSELYLVVGTNTSVPSNVTNAAGDHWGGVVGVVASHAGADVTVFGGDDIEADSGWAQFDAVENWVTGYTGRTDALYLDFGDAGGCPTTYSNATCNNGWTQHEIWDEAWGHTLAMSAPEIYYATNGAQWQAISNGAGTIGFSGPLDEYPATAETGSDAWSDLGCDSSQSCAFSLQIRDSN